MSSYLPLIGLLLIGLALCLCKTTRKVRKRPLKVWDDGFDLEIMPAEVSNMLLANILRSYPLPFIVGRLGAAEACLVAQYLSRKEFPAPMVPCKKPHRDSGIYPETPEGLLEFGQIYAEALKTLGSQDVMASFENIFHQERTFLSGRGIKIVHHQALMPFTFKDPWSQHLANKTVLIVHPFKASIECQLRKSEKKSLWKDERVLPKFNAKFVKMPQALGNSTPHGSYKETLESVYEQIEAAYPFDIALVSAGGYSMPIAVRVRSKNATAIIMGGAGQLLFGLKGKRWDSKKDRKKYYSAGWMYPLSGDMPSSSALVEDKGPYWAGKEGSVLSECPISGDSGIQNGGIQGADEPVTLVDDEAREDGGDAEEGDGEAEEGDGEAEEGDGEAEEGDEDEAEGGKENETPVLEAKDIRRMRPNELKEKLKARGLPTHGNNKFVLAKRLLEYIATISY